MAYARLLPLLKAGFSELQSVQLRAICLQQSPRIRANLFEFVVFSIFLDTLRHQLVRWGFYLNNVNNHSNIDSERRQVGRAFQSIRLPRLTPLLILLILEF